jgi:NAD-dependent SIR2 family protein deacetylase
MAHVVAWHLHADVAHCDQCGKPATVDVVEDDQVTVVSLCDDCLGPDTPDPIRDVFARALEAQEKCEQSQRDA